MDPQLAVHPIQSELHQSSALSIAIKLDNINMNIVNYSD